MIVYLMVFMATSSLGKCSWLFILFEDLYVMWKLDISKKFAASAITAEVCATAWGPVSSLTGIQLFWNLDGLQLCSPLTTEYRPYITSIDRCKPTVVELYSNPLLYIQSLYRRITVERWKHCRPHKHAHLLNSSVRSMSIRAGCVWTP